MFLYLKYNRLTDICPFRQLLMIRDILCIRLFRFCKDIARHSIVPHLYPHKHLLDRRHRNTRDPFRKCSLYFDKYILEHLGLINTRVRLDRFHRCNIVLVCTRQHHMYMLLDWPPNLKDCTLEIPNNGFCRTNNSHWLRIHLYCMYNSHYLCSRHLCFDNPGIRNNGLCRTNNNRRSHNRQYCTYRTLTVARSLDNQHRENISTCLSNNRITARYNPFCHRRIHLYLTQYHFCCRILHIPNTSKHQTDNSGLFRPYILRVHRNSRHHYARYHLEIDTVPF